MATRIRNRQAWTRWTSPTPRLRAVYEIEIRSWCLHVDDPVRNSDEYVHRFDSVWGLQAGDKDENRGGLIFCVGGETIFLT